MEPARTVRIFSEDQASLAFLVMYSSVEEHPLVIQPRKVGKNEDTQFSRKVELGGTKILKQQHLIYMAAFHTKHHP